MASVFKDILGPIALGFASGAMEGEISKNRRDIRKGRLPRGIIGVNPDWYSKIPGTGVFGKRLYGTEPTSATDKVLPPSMGGSAGEVYVPGGYGGARRRGVASTYGRGKERSMVAKKDGTGRPGMFEDYGREVPNTNIRGRGMGAILPSQVYNAQSPMPIFLNATDTILVEKAPRGYVMVTMPNGTRLPMERHAAIHAKLFRPAKKPPISVRDWESLKRADRVIKKLRIVGKKADHIAGYTTTRTKKVPVAPLIAHKHPANVAVRT